MTGASEIHPDADATRLARESAAVDDPTGWFERLYAAAAQGEAIVPWDRGAVHPMFLEWAEATGLNGRGSQADPARAVVVGCGTGENAEYLAQQGFSTMAFDISPAAVSTAKARFPHSQVDYLVGNLLDPPAGWRHAFDLVVEIFTVQSLPPKLHAAAGANTALLLRPGGTLLVVAAVADTPPEPDSGPPWPLTRDEVTDFGADGLELVRLEQVPV